MAKKDAYQLTNRQKAAILLISLGPDISAQIYKYLSEEEIEKLLKSFRKSMTVLLPYTEGTLAGWVHGRCEIIREEHTAEGVLLEVYVDEEAANRLKSFAVEG